MALIYVVEDDERIRRELVDILARAGFEIEACESFEHVSRDILAAAPDLVLLDLTLPVKDGQHICHEVRRESEVPIIVLTSRTTEIDEVMAMTLGADDFVPKPYSARVLVAHINALLRRTAAAGDRSMLVHKGLELDLARSMVTNTATGDSTELTKTSCVSSRCSWAARARLSRARLSCRTCGTPTPSWTTIRSPSISTACAPRSKKSASRGI